jgi:hypothetical protein
MRDVIIEATTTREVAVDRARQAAATAARADGDTAEEREREAVEAAAMAESITVPVMPRLLADDATPEALASLMAAQHGRIALISAEGGPFDMMAGRYSKLPNLDVYLKGHAGDHLRVDRKGHTPEFIDSPALTITICFQPAVLPTLASREGFRARGLLARFLFSVPESFVGTRKVGEPPLDPEVQDFYTETLQTLVLSLTEWTDPAVLRFSSAANAALLNFERDLEPQLGPSGELGPLADWASKLAGAVVRIAGLLHLAANLKTGYREAITDETFTAAARIGDYFRAHATAAHAVMGGGTALGDARVLLEWITRTNVETFTKRDAHRAHQSRFTKAADLDPALELLETHGWTRRHDNEPDTTVGRPPSPTYDVHPGVVAGTLQTR